MNLVDLLGPVASNYADNLIPLSKEKEQDLIEAKYEKIASDALSQISKSLRVSDLGRVSVVESVNQFKKNMEKGENPILAGINVAHTLFENRDTLTTELIGKVKLLGNLAKEVLKGTEALSDTALKRPRLS